MNTTPLAIWCLFSVLLCSVLAKNSITPSVIVPGLSASALFNTEVVLDKRRWVNEFQLADGSYKKHLKTLWNGTLLSSYEAILPYPGLEAVVDIAGPDAIEPWMFVEFGDLVNAIQSQSGAVGAVPYDWRLVPQLENLLEFKVNMECEISKLYTLYHQKVYIIAHSLGNLMTLWYLHNEDPEFISTHIAGYIGAAPPFGGAGLGIQAVTYGTMEGKYHIPSSLLGNFASFGWVFPQQRAFHTPVVEFPTIQYYPSELPIYVNTYSGFDSNVTALYNQIIAPFDFSIFEDLPPVLDIQTQVHIFVSTSNATCIGIKNVDQQWHEIYEQPPNFGDGTVPYNSLHANDDAWNLQLGGNLDIIQDANHSYIIRHQDFISKVMVILGGTASPGTV